MATESRHDQEQRQFDAFRHFPPAVHTAALRLLEAIGQMVPLAPVPPPEGSPPRYPRSALELTVLDALHARWPFGKTAHELARELPYPRAAISTTLQALAKLGTIHRYYHGTYCLGPPLASGVRLQAMGISEPVPQQTARVVPRRPDLPNSARYAAQIARIVAQSTSPAPGDPPAIPEP